MTEGVGRVYLDTNVFVDLVEGKEDNFLGATTLFAALQRKRGFGVTSELTLAEVLAPARRPAALPVHVKRRPYLDLLVFSGFIQLESISRDILYLTVDLRSVVNLKLADAIHMATAQRSGCTFFVSHDKDLRRLPQGMQHVKDYAGASWTSLMDTLQ